MSGAAQLTWRQLDGEARRRLAAVAVMNMAQKFPMAFIGTGIAAIYREHGLALEMLWVWSIPAIPYMLKWAWAPLVDRIGSERFGRRKSWIVPCTLGATLLYGAVAFVQPTLAGMWLAVGLMTLKSVVMSTQDIAVDAYTIEHMKDEERHFGSALLTVCGAIAFVFGFSGMTAIYDWVGWTPAAVLASALLLLFTLPIMLRREAPVRHCDAEAAPATHWRAVANAAVGPRGRWVMLLSFVEAFCFSWIGSFAGVFSVDMKFSLGQIGLMVALGYGMGTLVGNFAAARLLAGMDEARGIRWGVLIAVLGGLPLAAYAQWGQPGDVWPWCAAFFVIVAARSVLLLQIKSATYRWPSPQQPGTDFTVWASVSNGGSALAGAVGGFVAAAAGWSVFFALYAPGYVLLGLLYAFVWRRLEGGSATPQAQGEQPGRVLQVPPGA